MRHLQKPKRTVFVVFRYIPKVEDAVDVIKLFFDQKSQKTKTQWQVDILGSSLPSGEILLQGVVKAVRRADLVLVVAGDISHNVAFELGLAYGLEKPFILLAPEEVVHQIPTIFSDIAGMKCAVYDPDRIMKIPEVLEEEFTALERQVIEQRKEALSPDYLLALGDMLSLEGLWGEAISKYEAACDLSPGNVHYLVRLGQAHASVYDLSESEEVLRQAVSIDPECALAVDALGQTLLDGGQYERALEECYLPLLEKFPETESYYFKVSIAHTELGRPEKAARFLEKATERGIESGALLYDLAWTALRACEKYKDQKREEWVKLGLTSLKKATEIDPDFKQRADQDQDFDGFRSHPSYPD